MLEEIRLRNEENTRWLEQLLIPNSHGALRQATKDIRWLLAEIATLKREVEELKPYG